MSSRKRAAAIAVLLLCDDESPPKKKPRRVWVKQWLQRRAAQGCYHNLMAELAVEHSDAYRRWIRMDVGSFTELVEKVSPFISRRNSNFREAITAAERLSITLRFLATGETYQSLSFQFRVAPSTISVIVAEASRTLYHVLHEEFLRTPQSETEWKAVAQQFYKQWNYPGCLGALDGKHCIITPPAGHGSYFFNYKGQHSLILLALVDADLKFIYIDAGTNGRVSDGGVWQKSGLKKAIDAGHLHLPEPEVMGGSEEKLPYTIVADEAFGLSKYCMRPYPGRELDEAKRIFNYRLSRARRCVENGFGILASRWRIYKSPMSIRPETAVAVIKATCVLHNFLRCKALARQLYSPDSFTDREDTATGLVIPGEWRNYEMDGLQPLRSVGSNCSKEAKLLRERMVAYFNGPGSVPWQHKAYH